jgi:2-polyprenyl-6-methoxyphenol hydroxylase-like FAD-dependent oxidoreductase
MTTDTAVDTDVLIVGGGPVGLALAADLAYRGVDFLVVDIGDGVVEHPRIGTIGTRSMELFRRWGFAAEVSAAGWPDDHSLDVAWVTSVGGHEVHRLDRGTVATRTPPTYTPEPERVCPQHWLAPILTRHAGERLRLRHRVESFTQYEDHVAAIVSNVNTSEKRTVRARYLAGCDGTSSRVRKACDVGASHRHEARVFRNILFRAPELHARLGPRNALFYFLMRSTRLRFPMRSMDGDGLYRITERLDGQHGPPEPPLDLIAKVITDGGPVELLSVDEWHLVHWVADEYRVGRVLLVGDAAHTLSPSGGFGLNTGIADAADLGWKLAAELAGWAGSGLLDTYHAERRPVAIDSLEESNANLVRTLNRELPAALGDDTPEGARARAEMAARLARGDVRGEFDTDAKFLGVRYASKIVVDEPGGSTGWPPSSAPGSRAPHVWLHAGVSTLDLFGHGFTLLCFGESERRPGFERAFAGRRVPLAVTACTDSAVAQLYERRFVLVRPDGHVAWRGDELPQDAGWLVDTVRGAT